MVMFIYLWTNLNYKNNQFIKRGGISYQIDLKQIRRIDESGPIFKTRG